MTNFLLSRSYTSVEDFMAKFNLTRSQAVEIMRQFARDNPKFKLYHGRTWRPSAVVSIEPEFAKTLVPIKTLDGPMIPAGSLVGYKLKEENVYEIYFGTIATYARATELKF